MNLDFLSQYFTEVHFAKGQLITRVGEVENSLYYLSEGIVRFFYYNPTTLLIEKMQREAQFLLQSPEEIYLNLLEKDPKLIQNIPLKYIASYIGITPQALSRIRKRIF